MTEKRVKRILNLKENAKDEIDIEIKRVKRKIDEERGKLDALETSLERLLEGFQPAGSPMNPVEFELFYNSVFELQEETSREKTDKIT